MSEREGARTHPLTPLAEGVLSGGWLLGVLVVGFATGESWARHVPWWGAALAVLALVLGSAAATAASWWFTHYVLDATELRQTRGVLVHRSRRVPYERIQSVDVTEPFVARILGLAQLEVESAGGSDSTTRLRYLPLAEAQRMRAWLLQRAAAAPGPDPAETAPLTHDVVRVPLGRLVLGTAVRLDVVALAVLTVGVMAVGLGARVAGGGWGLVVAGAGLGLGLGRVIVERVVANWGFTLERHGTDLRIERGLLSRVSQTIPLDRLQGLIVGEPVVWRRLGWAHVDVDVAGYGVSDDDDGLESRATLLPIATRAEAMALVTRLLGGTDVEQVPRTSAPGRARWVDPWQWRRRWLGLDDRVLVSRRGILRQVTHVAPVRKIQSAGLAQGPWQRRLGLATLVVHTPPGPLDAEAAHLDAADVRAALERLRPLLDRPVPQPAPRL